ncbi:TetR/AcrR family transcriptional regulator [Geomonas sp. RF6]|uniref:TetR/AcrR family transcriptional regulator n=1 Tax=Geomonas sp. RF6 TaxID=2897342 RepID=UPI001E472AD1|nr:TetR/AcrR family transcriptional regulator [Geomonas sp. RF6]UFS71470.1 TetR/AcrR family transcriptional regulator [Geomonas sp. RF6]
MEEDSKYPRRRSKEAHQAILAATLDLVQENGYFGLSLEAVAARAGVGKQTIYRWWSSKAMVVLEAYALAVAEQIPMPDTGAVEEDLFRLLDSIFTRIATSGSGKALAGLIAEAQADPNFAEAFRSGFIESRREGVRGILRKGIERGELNAEIDLEVAVDALFGPMWYRLLMQHAPLDASFARQLVRQLIAGIATGQGRK